MEENIVWYFHLFFVFFRPTRLVFLDVLNLFHLVRYRKRAVWLSIRFHFIDIFILFSSFGVLWRPRSCYGSCQVGYIMPVSWEPPIWNIRTLVSIIYKLFLWKATLSDKLIYFCLLLNNKFGLFRCIGPFLFCAISCILHRAVFVSVWSHFDFSILLRRFSQYMLNDFGDPKSAVNFPGNG